MGSRKHNSAEALKDAKKTISFAKLNNCPSSPQKMRLIADLIRGTAVEQAINVLKYSKKAASEPVLKLLLSAMANWQAKNDGVRMEDSNLYIKEIAVDGGRVLKRVRPAPQGRANRIKKRSNHVTLIIDSRNVTEETATENKDDNK